MSPKPSDLRGFEVRERVRKGNTREVYISHHGFHCVSERVGIFRAIKII